MGNTLFFYYCFLLSVFILISGVVGNKNPTTLAIQVGIFLPIVGYFVFTAIRGLPKQQPGKRQSMLSALIFLSILVGIGSWSVYKNKTSAQVVSPIVQFENPLVKEASSGAVVQKTSSLSATTTLRQAQGLRKLMLEVITDSPNIKVNIRKFATSSAEILQKAQSGTKFEYLTIKKDWYQILLEDKTMGFINKEFVHEK